MDNVYFKHVRPTMFYSCIENKVFDMTLAGKVTGDRVKIGIGVCSDSDQFCKRDGRIEAIERLTYYPIYSLPIMHKKDSRAVHYWFSILSAMIADDSKLIKDFVIRKQHVFEKTEFGIQRKMQRQRERVEAKEALEQAKAERKLLHKARAQEHNPSA